MDLDRRLFLLGTTVATAQAFQAEATVNTAMIGVGNRGSFLLQGVLRQPNAKVLALCDITKRLPQPLRTTQKPMPTGTALSRART